MKSENCKISELPCMMSENSETSFMVACVYISSEGKMT